MGRGKTLIHIHTDFSFDSNITVEALRDFAVREGFGCVAVTDHDSIEGGLRLRGITDLNVIVGEEVTTRDGHLIGLFLQERIRPGMSAVDTARAIRAQGGVVLLPHPFVKAFGCGIGRQAWEMIDWIDAVEVNNAQNLLPGPDRLARRFAEETGLPAFVGADCHAADSIAPCWQVMDAFDGRQSFLRALAGAELHTGRHSLAYFAATGYRVALNAVGLKLPRGFGENAPATKAAPVLSPACRTLEMSS